MTRRFTLLMLSQCAFAGAVVCGTALLRMPAAASPQRGTTARTHAITSTERATAALRKVGDDLSTSMVIVDAYEESEDAPVHRRAVGVMATRGGFIFTPAFVVEDADFVIVNFGGENRSPAHVIALDRSSQLAILKTNFVPDGTGCPELGDPDSERANTALVMLSPEAKPARSLTGSVVALREQVGPLNRVLEVDVVGVPSALGGILLNGKGQLMGIALATATADAKPVAQGAVHSKVYVLPASRIREAIDRLVQKAPVPEQPRVPVSTA